jgi:hypothetical protein
VAQRPRQKLGLFKFVSAKVVLELMQETYICLLGPALVWPVAVALCNAVVQVQMALVATSACLAAWARLVQVAVFSSPVAEVRQVEVGPFAWYLLTAVL